MKEVKHKPHTMSVKPLPNLKKKKSLKSPFKPKEQLFQKKQQVGS